ncbi:MAG: ATP-binding protein [Candidatus Symbiothrix sp.]|jgi:hypothetical protein|nr:ATP-binding protein [Candidatus Symbiothrix sp.]
MNPFNPAFGRKPEHFVGRDHVISEFSAALEDPNSPWRTTILIGIRGSGKTAILSDIQKFDNQKKKITVNVTATDDMLNNILSEIYRKMPKSIKKSLPSISDISAFGIGVKFIESKDVPNFTNSFRFQLTKMLDFLKQQKIQIIFLIDEVQKHSEDMRNFVTTYQHIVRENYDVVLLMAGLPEAISSVLRDRVLTFLRRANRVTLENVSVKLVQLEYFESFNTANKKLSLKLSQDAAQATFGYPYLIQLLGYYLWQISGSRVTPKNFKEAVVRSKVELFRNVHELILDSLSPKDRDFIFAMSHDDVESNFSDIVERMGKKKNYISNYRKRCLEAGVIKATGYGKISYTLPYMKEFLEENCNPNQLR